MTGSEATGGLKETAGIEICGKDEAVAEAVAEAVDVAVDVGVPVSGEDVDGLPGVVVVPASVVAEGSAVTEASSVGAAVFVALEVSVGVAVACGSAVGFTVGCVTKYPVHPVQPDIIIKANNIAAKSIIDLFDITKIMHLIHCGFNLFDAMSKHD
jgi:hypothetical protein